MVQARILQVFGLKTNLKVHNLELNFSIYSHVYKTLKINFEIFRGIKLLLTLVIWPPILSPIHQWYTPLWWFVTVLQWKCVRVGCQVCKFHKWNYFLGWRSLWSEKRLHQKQSSVTSKSSRVKTTMTVDNGKWIQLSNSSSVCTWRLKQMSLRCLKEHRCAQYIAVYALIASKEVQ